MTFETKDGVTVTTVGEPNIELVKQALLLLAKEEPNDLYK